jgi:hypothetical protein
MHPTPLPFKALSLLTVKKFGMNCGNGVCVGSRHRKFPEAKLDTQEVRIGEPKTTSLKEKNGKRLFSSFFGQMRCQKSPTRVFGCYESIGIVFKFIWRLHLQVLLN